MAVERPHQVRGIFIRDVTTERAHLGDTSYEQRRNTSSTRVDRMHMPGGYPGEFDALEDDSVVDDTDNVARDSAAKPAIDNDQSIGHVSEEAPPQTDRGPFPFPATLAPAPGIRRTTTTASTDTTETAEEERKTVADLQALTAEQENLHELAEMWEQRLASARAALPKGVVLSIFTDPAQVEHVAQRLVRRQAVHPEAEPGAVHEGQGDREEQARIQATVVLEEVVGKMAGGQGETLQEAVDK
jgi:hypothetical protein